MADLVALVFPNEQKAEEVRNQIMDMMKDYLIEIGDAAIAEKTESGVKLHQMVNTTAAGAAGGSFWGLLIGVLFMNPLVGVAAGAAGGAIAGALTDVGVNDKFMKGLAEDVAVGEAVLFVLIRKVTADKALERLQGVGGRVLHTSLSNEAEERLQAALSGTAAEEASSDEPPAAPA